MTVKLVSNGTVAQMQLLDEKGVNILKRLPITSISINADVANGVVCHFTVETMPTEIRAKLHPRMAEYLRELLARLEDVVQNPGYYDRHKKCPSCQGTQVETSTQGTVLGPDMNRATCQIESCLWEGVIHDLVS